MPCEHFGRCGGCAYLDIPYADELAMKEAQVRALLAPFAIPDWQGILPAPFPTGYRNKMEFAFGDAYKDGPLALGIRKKRSFYEVAAPTDCALIPEDFKTLAAYILRFCADGGETFFHRKRHTGTLRHAVLRRGEFTGELLVNLVTTGQTRLDMDGLAAEVCALPGLDGRVTGVLHTVNEAVSDTVKNENARVIAGRGYYNERLCGLDFRVGAFSFFQTNTAGAQVLYNQVRAYAGGGKTALDAYCGTGTIAQLLAPGFDRVTGIELNPEAAQAATENARLNRLGNCVFHAGDAGLLIAQLPDRPDVVVVDPPRDGLHPRALAAVAALEAKTLVYVACKPASLARDMALLATRGYAAAQGLCVDLFPRTPHVETVMRMDYLSP